MSWLKLDDRLDEHPKLTRANGHYDAALSTFVQLGLYCARNLTDGVVPARVLQRFNPEIIELLSEPFGDRPGMLEDGPQGSKVLHDYLDYNPTREKVEADRAAAKVRQQEWRDRHNT
jgi:hypothetical protein